MSLSDKTFGGIDEDVSLLTIDVKEFIRLLKEEINENAFGELININNKIIDKLAGDKLTGCVNK